MDWLNSKADYAWDSQYAGIKVFKNPSNQHMVAGTFISSQNCACGIATTDKIFAAHMNTALLAAIIATGIAYKMGVFVKLKNYFYASDQNDDQEL